MMCDQIYENIAFSISSALEPVASKIVRYWQNKGSPKYLYFVIEYTKKKSSSLKMRKLVCRLQAQHPIEK